jgi:hypothetical protein
MNTEELSFFLHSLIHTPDMQSLWSIRDAGMPVFAHSIDVAMLALDAFWAWQEEHGLMQPLPVVLGSLVHDLSKASARRERQAWRAAQPTGPAHSRYAGPPSHSTIMRYAPHQAVFEAADVLARVERDTGISLPVDDMEAVCHIVAAHHGPWGGVPPQTPEAALVHACDLYSSRHHRLSPWDANDLLPLLDQGHSLTRAARLLGVSYGVARQRLAEACQAEWVDSVEELLLVWRRREYVVTGPEERQAERELARRLIAQARQAPACLLGHPVIRDMRPVCGNNLM